jgi:hypothetical protein
MIQSDGPDRWSAGVAKGQQEAGHASGVTVSCGGRRMASTACGVRVKESSGPMEIGDTQAVIIQTLTARGYGKPEM